MQALTLMLQSLLLLPWVFFHVMIDSSPILWSSLLPCVLATSLLLVYIFYMESIATQHSSSHHVAVTSSCCSFGSALLLSVLAKQYSDQEQGHELSVGVFMGGVLFVLATPSLARPVRSSHGLLVGYSTSGLPLYSSQPSTASVNWLKPFLSRILENTDSRRIFYFLMLNFVGGQSSHFVIAMHL